jgi:hypothetical protein
LDGDRTEDLEVFGPGCGSLYFLGGKPMAAR